MDRLTKSAHFIPVKSSSTAVDYARIYINEIVSLHGIYLSIVSDRGVPSSLLILEIFPKGFRDSSET